MPRRKKVAHASTAQLNQARREGWASFIRGEQDERAVAAGYRYSRRRADHVAEFFRRFLRHSQGEWKGKPFELLSWQRDELLCPLFGWVDAAGRRQYNKAFVEIPKKNGKSTLCAGVGLYLLLADDEPGAQVYSAAVSQTQAGIVHGEAVKMVQASPELRAATRVNLHTKCITYDATQSYYRALSRSPEGNEGLNAHGIICDELHAWHGRELWDALLYAGRARRQPLTFVITTAGADRESICYELHEYALGVQAGTIPDPRFFAFVRHATEADDWSDPAVWRKANPSLGSTFHEGTFREEYEQAKRSPASLAQWARYSLNVWSNTANPWLPAGAWESARAEYAAEDLDGGECWLGLDLSQSNDTTALVAVFPDAEESERVWLLPRIWLPEESLDAIADRWPARAWAAAGYLDLTPGAVVDYETILQTLDQYARRYRVRGLAFDPYFAGWIVSALQDRFGWPAESLIPFPQRITHYAEPTATFERLLLAGRLHHPGNPVLDWQMSHVHVKTDVSGNSRPVKFARADHRKVDAVQAAVMALGLWSKGEQAPRPGVAVWSV